jgi:hypothetical protein
MTRLPRAGATDLDAVSFELERFELADDERIEISGRWFGVRGRRFVRPSLTVSADGATRRALAVLEHKPWDPSDGVTWKAAFPWNADPDEIVDAELAVAPDIAVSLPALTSGRARNGRRAAGAPPSSQHSAARSKGAATGPKAAAAGPKAAASS